MKYIKNINGLDKTRPSATRLVVLISGENVLTEMITY